MGAIMKETACQRSGIVKLNSLSSRSKSHVQIKTLAKQPVIFLHQRNLFMSCPLVKHMEVKHNSLHLEVFVQQGSLLRFRPETHSKITSSQSDLSTVDFSLPSGGEVIELGNNVQLRKIKAAVETKALLAVSGGKTSPVL